MILLVSPCISPAVGIMRGCLERQLTIEARHDGLGTVWCNVRLREPSPPEWDFRARLGVEAGTQLDKLADEIDGFVGDR